MRSHSEASKTGQKSIVLIGNPNVGKSVIFNRLTGKYVVVSNYPGTSVEITEGTAKIAQHTYKIIDTPGVYNLIPLSEDERITRDILLENEDIVVQVIDSKNLERGLLITLQLGEMGKQVILDLNMSDEAAHHGIKIDKARLESMTGLKSAQTDAVRSSGIDRLRKILISPGDLKLEIHYRPEIEDAVTRIMQMLPPSILAARFVAVSVLSGDHSIVEWLAKKFPQFDFIPIA